MTHWFKGFFQTHFERDTEIKNTFLKRLFWVAFTAHFLSVVAFWLQNDFVSLGDLAISITLLLAIFLLYKGYSSAAVTILLLIIVGAGQQSTLPYDSMWFFRYLVVAMFCITFSSVLIASLFHVRLVAGVFVIGVFLPIIRGGLSFQEYIAEFITLQIIILSIAFMIEYHTKTTVRALNRLGKATAELEVAYQEQGQLVERLNEANRLKTTFLHSMSHELRTPLNSVIGFSTLLLEEVGDYRDEPLGDAGIESFTKDLAVIKNNGNHLLAMINDILDMARIEAGKLEIDLDYVEPGKVAHQAMMTIRGYVSPEKKDSLEFTEDVPGDLPPILADETRLRQILLNLLSNAVKFTPQGMVGLRVWVEQDSMFFAIQDSGIGIAPDDLPKLFAQFERIENDVTRRVGGTGLGLPISRELARLQGGNLSVQSVVGQGSTFTRNYTGVSSGMRTLPSKREPRASHTLRPCLRMVEM